MRERYVVLAATAHAETAKAFCCSFVWEEENYAFSNLWIPKSVIHDEFLDNIDEAERGETIEIAVARWWLKERI